MSSSTNGQTVRKIFLVGLFALPFVSGCWNGDTDGGSANDNTGIGTTPVSNGGFGASLTIDLDDGSNEIAVGDRKGFHVTALDPQGLPLARQRVFCESEKGIAIIEPSSGGVAFESTNLDGKMSGVLGGAQPGSYLLECRLEEGFNLIARKSLKITGDVPAGFAGFPGAAGGNLGGGTIVPNPNTITFATNVQWQVFGTTTFADTAADIDTVQDTCTPTGGTATLEPFGIDLFQLTVSNPLNQSITLDSIRYTIKGGNADGSDVDGEISIGNVIAPGTTVQIPQQFDVDFDASGGFLKRYIGTDSIIHQGTYTIDFSVRGEQDDGDSFSLDVSSTFTATDYNNCPAGSVASGPTPP